MSIPVSKTLDQVRAELYARLSETHTAYAAAGWLPRALNLNKGVLRGLIELWAWGLYALYQFLFAILKQGFPESATGAWLDLHSAQVGVARRSTTKASGTVIFSRSGTSGNVPIPAGRIVRTLPDGAGTVYRYVTDADAVLPAGQTSVAVPVTAEEYGAASNVVVGSITELSTVVQGIESVTNTSDWLTSEGADAETDAPLRERYFLRWMEANGCTKYAYRSWALRVPGVIAVAILDQHPRGQGTVDVVVKGAAGLPTQALLDAVAAEIAPEAPINDDWLVKAPVPVSVAVVAHLELVPDTGDAAAVTAAAEARLRALFTDPTAVEHVSPLQIGEDLPLTRLTGTVMYVSGIKSVVWTSPPGDIVVPGDGLAVLASLALTSSYAGEI
jgi:uncharacterized phage protein gp47/JayE